MASARSRRPPGGSAVVPPPPEVTSAGRSASVPDRPARSEVASADRPAPSVPGRLAAFALVLVLTVLLALWGAFLVPLRVHGVAVPVGIALALTTFPLCRAGGDALGRRTGAAVPMAVWAVIAALLSSERREGDLVITGSVRGLLFLVAGLLAAAVGVGSWRPADDAAERGSGGPGPR